MIQTKTKIYKKKTKPSITAETSLEYLGVVNYATNERVLSNIKSLMMERPGETIYLTVTSPGGPTGTAMSFYDQVNSVLKPKLVTIGSGDVDSSGIIIFLSGETRYVTRHTTIFFHLAGRTFDGTRRFTALDLEAMAREDKIKDLQYATLVAERSRGRLTREKVLSMMEKNTLCTPEELVAYGLADSVLE